MCLKLEDIGIKMTPSSGKKYYLPLARAFDKGKLSEPKYLFIINNYDIMGEYMVGGIKTQQKNTKEILKYVRNIK